MTTLLTILSVIGLIAICYVVGKYNKNDNLFWLLVISLLAGMAGGAIVHKLETAKNKNITTTTQVYNPTQVLPAVNSIDFYAVLGSSRAIKQEPVGQDVEIPALGSSLCYAPSKSSREIRGQPPQLNPHNKGTPGMPFDTS